MFNSKQICLFVLISHTWYCFCNSEKVISWFKKNRKMKNWIFLNCLPYVFIDKITYKFVLFKCNYPALYILITHNLTSLLIVFVGIMCYKTWNFKYWSNTEAQLDVKIWKCALKSCVDLYIFSNFWETTLWTQCMLIHKHWHTIERYTPYLALYGKCLTTLAKIERALN